MAQRYTLAAHRWAATPARAHCPRHRVWKGKLSPRRVRAWLQIPQSLGPKPPGAFDGFQSPQTLEVTIIPTHSFPIRQVSEFCQVGNPPSLTSLQTAVAP